MPAGMTLKSDAVVLDDILQETEELIKIFVTSIKSAEKKPRLGVVECSVSGVCFFHALA